METAQQKPTALRKLYPALWSSLLFIGAEVLALRAAYRAPAFLEEHNAAIPQISDSSQWLPAVWFFVAAALIGVVLFFVPISKLRVILRVMFTGLYAWGGLVLLALLLPLPAAVVISLAAALAWFITPRVWLHNLLLLITLVAVAAIFGVLLSPWATVIFLAAASVYDILAVRLGYMEWMAKKMAESDSMPAFAIPRKLPHWGIDLRQAGFSKLFDESPEQREFSILGGGDIGFPVLLGISVYVAYGLGSALIVGVFSLAGLMAAYLIHLFMLRGRAMPALPPIFLFSLLGLLAVRFL